MLQETTTMKSGVLTWTRANEMLRYEPETSRIYWRKACGRAKAGDEAGWRNGRGYKYVTLDGVGYRDHYVIKLLKHSQRASWFRRVRDWFRAFPPIKVPNE